MSQFHNNNLLHNLRVGVRMVNAGVPPEVAAFAMTYAGIPVSPALLAAAAKPDALTALESGPFTHARADAHIAAHQAMQQCLVHSQQQACDSNEQVGDAPMYSVRFNDDSDEDGL